VAHRVIGVVWSVNVVSKVTVGAQTRNVSRHSGLAAT
jgi:hypothetical protein